MLPYRLHTPALLIDAIGQFFRGSKIPFDHLQLQVPERTLQWTQIRADLDTFARQAQSIGCNAVSLDDVTHLASHAWYEPKIRAKIAVYREEFSRCFELLRQRGLASISRWTISVIIRIGEADGRDVHDDFRSELQLNNPAEANAFLRLLLPVFENTTVS